ncbi:hypothetical protein Hanom_Chr14g01269391 [Helianthus anomalus]
MISWCKGTSLFVFSAKDLVQLHWCINKSNKWNKAIYSMVQTTVWCIWRCGNKFIFQQEQLWKTLKLLASCSSKIA